MRLLTIKFGLGFLIIIFITVIGNPKHVLANAPNLYGTVVSRATGAGIPGAVVHWTDTNGQTRTGSTDGNGGYMFPSWQDMSDGDRSNAVANGQASTDNFHDFGCMESPHTFTAFANGGADCTPVTTSFGNGGASTTVPPIPCGPPPPTPVPCGGPCTNNSQCDKSCPVCGPNNTCGPPVACGGPCTASTQCDLSCPICGPNKTCEKVPCGGPCSDSTQCDQKCPVCSTNKTCSIGCGSSCSDSQFCDITCPICGPNKTCVPPTPTPFCGGPCDIAQSDCPLTCPLCAPGPGGTGTVCQPHAGQNGPTDTPPPGSVTNQSNNNIDLLPTPTVAFMQLKLGNIIIQIIPNQ